jgi:hypothetical protein
MGLGSAWEAAQKMKSLRRIRNRQHRCFELALKAMLDEPGADRFTLVHGNIAPGSLRYPHAWIELGDGRVYDAVTDTYEPADQFTAKNRAMVDHRYSREEAISLFLVAPGRSPWTDDERRDAEAVRRKWESYDIA